jgi:hypothetical protein
MIVIALIKRIFGCYKETIPTFDARGNRFKVTIRYYRFYQLKKVEYYERKNGELKLIQVTKLP